MRSAEASESSYTWRGLAGGYRYKFTARCCRYVNQQPLRGPVSGPAYVTVGAPELPPPTGVSLGEAPGWGTEEVQADPGLNHG